MTSTLQTGGRQRALPAPAISVDLFQGLDIAAPGLFRAQEPLAAELGRDGRYDIDVLRPSVPVPQLWFPYLYGPLPLRLLLRRAPLVHVGNAWYAHLVPLLRRPAIVTCHDTIELDELESGARRFRPHRAFHIRAAFRGMTRARFIVCVSRATADRVLAHNARVADRIRVVHSGVSPVFGPGEPDAAVLRRLGVVRPYVLYVGSDQGRKNLPRLVAAIGEARRSMPEFHFVKVGASQTEEGRRELLAALDRAGLRGRTVIVDRIADEDLVSLYRGAVATALVSLAEGFGFPALEAMACGCPAIISRDAALCEVTGGKAIAVDPLDVGAIARAILRVATDPELRRLSSDGISRASRFTWERAASAYAELYEEALAGP